MAKVGNPQTNKIDRYLTFSLDGDATANNFEIPLRGFIKQFNYLITPSNPLFMTVSSAIITTAAVTTINSSATSDPIHPGTIGQNNYDPFYELYIANVGMSSTQNKQFTIDDSVYLGTFLAQVLGTGFQGDAVSSYRLSHANTFCCTGNHNIDNWTIYVYDSDGVLNSFWTQLSLTFHFYQL